MTNPAAARTVEMLRALAPFAALAQAYEGFEDEAIVVSAGEAFEPVRVTVRDLRAARDAMAD